MVQSAIEHVRSEVRFPRALQERVRGAERRLLADVGRHQGVGPGGHAADARVPPRSSLVQPSDAARCEANGQEGGVVPWKGILASAAWGFTKGIVLGKMIPQAAP